MPQILHFALRPVVHLEVTFFGVSRGFISLAESTVENMGEIETADYDKYLNPESVIEVDDAKIEPSLGEAKPGEKFQFVRTGYFTPDSKHANRFNRIVSLKDGYKF